MMYRIIANETDFLVVSKAPGVHFHSQSGSAGVMAQIESDLKINLYAIHRLDTPTSGLLLFAKSSESAASLTQLFTDRAVNKYYIALAKGKPKKKQGWIIGDMAKSRRSMYKLLRSQDNPAVTQFFSYAVSEGLRLYLLKPHSGKTHQLRVALASMSTPILGDDLYGGLGADRTYLHAFYFSMTFGGVRYQYLDVPDAGLFFQQSEIKNQIVCLKEPEQLNWPERK